MSSYTLPDQLSNCVSAVSASTAGGLSMIATYPLDQIKTILQVDADSILPLPKALQPLGTTLGGLVYLSSTNPKRLLIGASASTETVMISNFIYYYLLKGTDAKLSNIVNARNATINPIISALVSSTIAGCLNVIVTEPLWRASTIVKLRTSDSSTETQSVLLETIKLIRKEVAWTGNSFRSFYQGFTRSLNGLGASLLLVSNPVIQYIVQVTLRDAVVRGRRKNILTAKEAFLIGAIAKAVATWVTYPLQVIQSRLRAVKDDTGRRRNDSSSVVFASLREVVEENGICGLYSGVGAKLTQTVANAALMYLFMEGIDAKLRSTVLHWYIMWLCGKGRKGSA